MIDAILSSLLKDGQSHRVGNIWVQFCQPGRCLLGTQGWHRAAGGSKPRPQMASEVPPAL